VNRTSAGIVEITGRASILFSDLRPRHFPDRISPACARKPSFSETERRRKILCEIIHDFAVLNELDKLDIGWRIPAPRQPVRLLGEELVDFLDSARCFFAGLEISKLDG
jgi:hypothetical protein